MRTLACAHAPAAVLAALMLTLAPTQAGAVAVTSVSGTPVLMGQAWTTTRSGGVIPQWCLQEEQDQPHRISIGLSDGTFATFRIRSTPVCQSLVPIQFAEMSATPLAGSLGDLGLSETMVFVTPSGDPGPVSLLGDDFEVYDPFMITFRPQTETFTELVTDGSVRLRTADRHYAPGQVVHIRDAEVLDESGGTLLEGFDGSCSVVSAEAAAGGGGMELQCLLTEPLPDEAFSLSGRFGREAAAEGLSFPIPDWRNFSPAPVPEPSSLSLLLASVAGWMLWAGLRMHRTLRRPVPARR